MQAKIFAICVLTFLEVVYAVRIGLAHYTIKKSTDSQKVVKAKRDKAYYDWIFAIVMLVKFMLETSMMEVMWMPLWFIDMLISNFCVIQLVIKYFNLRKN